MTPAPLAALLLLTATACAAAPPPPAPMIDRAGLPPITRYAARDGAQLAYRAYPGDDRVAVLLHGSAGQSLTMNPLAKTLAATGASVYALDVRGHGASGPRGDIDHIGQLEDDLADLLAVVRRDHPGARITLIGFSAGGAFAIRAAGRGAQVDRVIALAPALTFPSRVARRGGGWARANIPAILAIDLADRLGLHAWDGATVIRFAVPPAVANEMTPAYSYRLAMNYSARDYRTALAHAPQPMTVIAGAADQQFYAQRYGPELTPSKPDLQVRIVPGLDHVGLITQPAGLAAIREVFLAKEGHRR